MTLSLQAWYSQTPGVGEGDEPSVLSYGYVACASRLDSFLLFTRRWKERVLEPLGFQACIKNENNSYVPHSRTLRDNPLFLTQNGSNYFSLTRNQHH